MITEDPRFYLRRNAATVEQLLEAERPRFEARRLAHRQLVTSAMAVALVVSAGVLMSTVLSAPGDATSPLQDPAGKAPAAPASDEQDQDDQPTPTGRPIDDREPEFRVGSDRYLAEMLRLQRLDQDGREAEARTDEWIERARAEVAEWPLERIAASKQRAPLLLKHLIGVIGNARLEEHRWFVLRMSQQDEESWVRRRARNAMSALDATP